MAASNQARVLKYEPRLDFAKFGRNSLRACINKCNKYYTVFKVSEDERSIWPV